MKDEVINKAIDKLSRLTKEDFHGYRSEIWNVLAEVYNSNRLDGVVMLKIAEAIDEEIKHFTGTLNDGEESVLVCSLCKNWNSECNCWTIEALNRIKAKLSNFTA